MASPSRKRRTRQASEKPHPQSGVRRAAAKAQPAPSQWITAASQVPVDDVLRLFADGDEEGAVVCGKAFFERAYVPVLVAGPRDLRDAALDMRARWLVPFIDGERILPQVLESCALPPCDALHAICVLLDQKLVVLR